MENAIKALYMVVGVLIGILIITFFVYMFSQGRKYMSSINDEEISRISQEYNAKILVYEKEGTKDFYNSVYDIVSLCNLAYDINKENDYDEQNKLDIIVNGVGVTICYTNDNEKNKITTKQTIRDLITNTTLGDPLNTLDRNLDNSRTEYKYKFDGKVTHRNSLGKIDEFTFTLVP